MSFPWRRGLRKCWRPPGSACPIMARVCPSSIHVFRQSAPLAIGAALRNRPCEVELGHSVAHQWELCSCSNVLAADGSSRQHRAQHHVVLLNTHQRSPCHALVFPTRQCTMRQKRHHTSPPSQAQGTARPPAKFQPSGSIHQPPASKRLTERTPHTLRPRGSCRRHLRAALEPE